MDAGLTSRPVTGVAVTDYARPAAAATAGTTPTDLPTEQAVTPAPDTTQTRNDTPQPASAGALTEYDIRSVTIDPQTREVIYRVIDSRTNQVINQVPDQTLLRNRAYSLAIANGATPLEAESQADLEA
jgi:flagellar protein FlaG